ncbi:MAG: hypothetical protein BMS9Abin28_0814 [Anaerolineae bacterium]|nr:MAG: hypothetical protein BMS9Abin28_0814 [Anaerolineae bacterium]
MNFSIFAQGQKIMARARLGLAAIARPSKIESSDAARNGSFGCARRILVRGICSAPSRLTGGERGLTIAEMLIAAVLAASAAGLIGTALYQFFVVTRDGNARLSVLTDLQNASLWLGRDAIEARSFTPGSGLVYGTLTAGDPTVQYRYSYDAGNTALVREHLVSGVPKTTLKIARRIANQADIAFTVTGSLLTVSIRSTGANGEIAESTTLKLSMRVK